MDFRPISRSLDLDLGHLGPISEVWASILARAYFCQFRRVWTSIWAILDIFQEFGPRFGAFGVYLEEFEPRFEPSRAYFLESGPGSGPFRTHFCLFQEFGNWI